jgi:hypothetical protein
VALLGPVEERRADDLREHRTLRRGRQSGERGLRSLLLLRRVNEDRRAIAGAAAEPRARRAVQAPEAFEQLLVRDPLGVEFVATRSYDGRGTVPPV